MKKFIALTLSVLMIASVFALAVPASAANLDPQFKADKSKIIGVAFPKAAAYANPEALIDGSYGGDNLNPCEGITAFGNGTTARVLGGTTFYEAATSYTAYSEKYVEGDAIYNVFVQLTLGTGTEAQKTKISSICFAVPAEASKVGGCVPDGFSLYYGDSIWFNTADNEAAKIAINKANWHYSCTVTGLYAENKYSVAADGSYRYYECNLPEPIEATYLLLLFSREFDIYVTAMNRENGADNAPTVYHYVTEFSAFSEELPVGDTAGTVEHKHVEETLEDDTSEETPATSEPETQAPETQAPETQAPETQAPETQAPETQAPETQAPATQAPETEPAKKKGCKESVSMLAVVAVMGAAVVFTRKRRV
jgi:hypothetical protein